VLFLDRLHEHKETNAADKNKHKELLQKLALRVIAGQRPGGGWDYNCPLLTPQKEQELLSALRTNTFTPGDRKFTPWGARYDNSISQFSVLALWVARKYDIPVATSLVLEEQRYRQHQSPTSGGWVYAGHAGNGGTAPMTCSGLLGLAIGHGIRDEVEEMKARKGEKHQRKKVNILEEPEIKKALAFVGQGLDAVTAAAKGEDLRARFRELTQKIQEAARQGDFKKRNELIQERLALMRDAGAKGIPLYSGRLDIYFLWSVERVAVIYGLDRIDGRDWYKYGSKVLVKDQNADGSWQGKWGGGPVGTSFALLFLHRTNLVKDLTDKLRQLRAAATIGNAPGRGPAPPQPARRDA
jgi:hypothetical protein